jgi:Family of unknown function (DUF5995)
MPPSHETIDDVLDALDGVIAPTHDAGSRARYLAGIHREVTARIAEGITSRIFDDAARMERLDVVFRHALGHGTDAHLNGDATTSS